MSIVIAEDLWWSVPPWVLQKYEVVYDPDLYRDRSELIDVARHAEGLVIRNKAQVDEMLLNELSNLRVIGRLGVGLDNIDLKVCRSRGISVVAARGFNANSVAEYVMAGILEHARFLALCDSDTKAGNWDRLRCMGRELSGKTLGLVGVGDIGQRVVVRARAFGMHVLAHDPFLLKSNMLVQDFGVELASLRDVCRRADYISVHVPLTPETYHLIGGQELRWMKDTAVVINTARGGIIDETALLHHLQGISTRYAILDVRETEPPGADDLLQQLPNVLLTPHIAGITAESSERVAEFVLREMDNALSNRAVQGAVI